MRQLRHFFANRRLQHLLLVVIPCAIFLYMRAQLSWRPRMLGQVKGEVTIMAWSPDNNWLAVTTALEDASAPLEIWDVQGRKLHGRLKTPAGYHNFLQFSADSRTLFALDSRFVLRSWNVADKRELKACPRSVNPLGFALSPDGSTFVQCETGIVERSVADGKLLWALDDPLAVVALARFSSDGKRLALLMWQSALAKGASLVVWNLDSAKTKSKPQHVINVKPHHAKSYGLTYLPDKNLVYLLGGFGEIYGYDLLSGSLKAKHAPTHKESPYWGNYAGVVSLAPQNLFAEISGSGDVAGAGVRNIIPLRQWPSCEIQRVLRTRDQNAAFRSPTFSPDGSILAAVDERNGNIILWRIK